MAEVSGMAANAVGDYQGVRGEHFLLWFRGRFNARAAAVWPGVPVSLLLALYEPEFEAHEWEEASGGCGSPEHVLGSVSDE